jgi:hypothetical protein
MPKHPGGRPTKYKPEYCQQLIKFFSGPRTELIVKAEITGKNEYHKTEYARVAKELPTLAKFARKIGVNKDTIVSEWVKKYPEFSDAYNTVKELQKEFLIDNGLAGLYPPASYIFTAKNITDMKDKSEVDQNIKGSISLTDLFNKAKE